jgi:hypothetical protein
MVAQAFGFLHMAICVAVLHSVDWYWDQVAVGSRSGNAVLCPYSDSFVVFSVLAHPVLCVDPYPCGAGGRRLAS